jgi:2-keto-4-pentenoate hydratase/2-oxohepta-3-ene-1,7-dioic acid hydratase in catechol pathway
VLEAGDVISTGTPGGVALARPDHPYLRPGDVVELSIEGLGSQRQEVVAG